MCDRLPPRERFGMLFVGVARRWRAALDASLATLGLSDATWPPLVHIGRSGGGLSQKELAALIGIDGSSLVRLLDALAERGLVERRQDAADRRSNRLFVTAAGLEALRRIQPVLAEAEGWMLADLDEEGMAFLTAALERIDARIHARRAAQEDLIPAGRSLDRSEGAKAPRAVWREAKQTGGLRPAPEGS